MYFILRNNCEFAFEIGFDSGIEIVPPGVSAESVVTAATPAGVVLSDKAIIFAVAALYD